MDTKEISKSKYFELWLGFGAFLVTYGGGPLGFTASASGEGVSWEITLFVQTAFFMGTALGCFLIWRVYPDGFSAKQKKISAALYVAITALSLGAQFWFAAFDTQIGIVVRVIASLIVGVFYSQPLLFWIDRFLDLNRTVSRMGLLVALLPCYLLDPLILSGISRVSGVPYIITLVQVICALASVAVQLLFFRLALSQGGVKPRGSSTEQKEYHLTSHATLVLVSLGFSWGIVEAVTLFVLGSGLLADFVLSAVFTVVLFATVVVVLQLSRSRSNLKFGMFIRLSLLTCGIILVSLPAIFILVPSFVYPFCNFIMIACEVSLIVFSLDICSEEGKTLLKVFAPNYLVFMGAICVANVFFVFIHTSVSGQLAWWIVSMGAVWVLLASITFLPSRSSDATMFTLEKLPENEGYEANIARRREQMIQRYRLTPGEAEVFNYLLQGMNREQIATAMYLSPWTIKSRISAIYKKCGVHSYKELLALISEG